MLRLVLVLFVHLASSRSPELGQSFLEVELGQDGEEEEEDSGPKSIHIATQKKFELECQCDKKIAIPDLGPTTIMKIPAQIRPDWCGADVINLSPHSFGIGMSQHEVATAIGNSLMIPWARVKYHHFSDFEGRTSSPILGTPGGDMAEFINALAAYENVQEDAPPLEVSDCQRLLKKYLTVTKKVSFGMLTDIASLEALGASLGGATIDPTSPPYSAELRDSLVDSLVLPDFTGSRFLKHVLQNHGQYDLREGLTECGIKAFYKLLWEGGAPGSKLRLVQTNEASSENAVLLVNTSEECNSQGLAPLIRPMIPDDFAMAVVHVQAVSILREELAEFMAGESEAEADATKLKEDMDARGEKFLERGCRMLAQGKPIYSLHLV